jgi:uncharacterized membrane protein (UPF0182 family)
VSGFFDDDPPRQPPRRPAGAPPQRSRALVGTALVLIVTFFLVSVFTGIWTDRLWFESISSAKGPDGAAPAVESYAGVYTKVLGTRVLLFVVFGLLLGAVVAANIALAYRARPLFRPASPEQANLDRYRDAVEPWRKWLVVGVAVVLGLFAGGSGSGQWRQFLMWRHGQDFNKPDPYFDNDIGFYVFQLPWLHYLVNFAMAVLVLSIIAAVVVHYVFGGIRLQAKSDRLTGAAQVHLSVLLGLFVLVKAVDYWLDRYNLTTEDGGLFTGMGFTDEHAVLPSKSILAFIALICALLLFANVLRRTWLLPSVGLALLLLSSILLGAIWPGIIQQFTVDPSEPEKEAAYIARNIAATRSAYGIDKAEVIEYDANLSVSNEQLAADASSLPGIRLIDPSIVSETFEQLQQVRGYYSVPEVLDVDRYPINGSLRDMVVAVREIDPSGLAPAQRNWANLHTVYTHGYGVIAAYGNQRNSQGEPVTDTDGRPVFAEQDLPPRGELTELFPGGYQPRIYFGETSPDYSIVGRPDGGDAVELDVPAGSGARPTNFTYDGVAGVPVGGFINQLLYAVKFSEPNIVLSSLVNEQSRILYDRSPRERVQKVAPWLAVDGDIYPAVVNGKVKWIVDGYTTSDQYPNSQSESLREMTSDSLQPTPTYATLPQDDINYIRNSVKAVVDAYDGTVTLYEWDSDPISRAWSEAFPGVVRPRSEIPPELLAHMRYPEDLFKVQRAMLQRYHVKNARAFYGDNDRWRLPEDPERKGQIQPPYRLSVQTPGMAQPAFSLTSVFLPNERQNLAAYMAVNSDPTDEGYGRMRLLRLPSNTTVPGPSQIANLFASDQEIQDARLAFTRTGSEVINGNLLTLPVGEGLLYVQPLYTSREAGAGRYPVLRYVLASFGDDVGIGSTLAEALDDVLGIQGTEDVANPEQPGTEPPPPGEGGQLPGDVESLLQEAEQKFEEAQAALQDGDLAAYAQATEEARDLVQQALEAAGQNTGQDAGQGAGAGAGGSDAGDEPGSAGAAE